MSSSQVIIIVPNSNRTINSDVQKLSGLIQTVVAKAGEKLRADFQVDIVSDFTFATGMLTSSCDHELVLLNGNGKMIAMEGKRFKGIKVKCLKCTNVFKVVRDRLELAEAMKIEHERIPG